MSKPPVAAATSLSPEARAFIRDAAPAKPRTVDPAAIGALREENRAKYAPAGQAIASEILAGLDVVKMGGVRVQICTPKSFDRAKAGRAILYLFGGGFVVGGPDEDLAITARLADLTGMRIYAPYYRLAPEHPFPAALEDALAVYASLGRLLQPGGLAIAGESAGGNLALAALLRASAIDLGMPAAAALLSPWCDLTNGSDSLVTHNGLDPTFSKNHPNGGEAVAYAGGADRTDPLISPIFAKSWRWVPPTLITSGTRDLLLSDSARLSTAMRRGGVDVRLHVWEGMWHVFECYPEIPESEHSLREIASFLLDHIDDGSQAATDF